MRKRWLAAALALAAIWSGVNFYANIRRQDPETMRRLGSFLRNEGQAAEADFIYVLGGDYLNRIPYAAELYRRRMAPRIVVPHEDMGWGSDVSPTGQEHFTHASLRMLREAGVPESGMVDWKWGAGVGSTADELYALRGYFEAFPKFRRAIVVTSDYHTRRVGYAAGRILPRGMEFIVLGAPVTDWNLENWWRHPVGRATVWGEYKRLVFYTFRYALG